MALPILNTLGAYDAAGDAARQIETLSAAADGRQPMTDNQLLGMCSLGFRIADKGHKSLWAAVQAVPADELKRFGITLNPDGTATVSQTVPAPAAPK
jgi:uncharacterized lipoprotein YajG